MLKDGTFSKPLLANRTKRHANMPPEQRRLPHTESIPTQSVDDILGVCGPLTETILAALSTLAK